MKELDQMTCLELSIEIKKLINELQNRALTSIESHTLSSIVWANSALNLSFSKDK